VEFDEDRLKVLTMLKEKQSKGDKEIPYDIFEQTFKDRTRGILESLKQDRYIKYECDSALIIKKGLDRLRELGK